MVGREGHAPFQDRLAPPDSEGYVWQRYVLQCQLAQGPGSLVLDVATQEDVGIFWDNARPSPNITGVAGMGEVIRYLKGEFRLGGQVHRFTGRGAHFSFRETLDNGQTGRFELSGERLLVYYPFHTTTPGVCTRSP